MKKQPIAVKGGEKKESEKFISDLIGDTKADFERRRKERATLERQWELDMNFISGNQYCGITARGDIADEGKEFFWQNRETFNHIAPLIESRVARFSKVAPLFSVRPKTDDDKDVNAASFAEKLLSTAFEKHDLDGTVKKVTVWSESCGTGFYKILWDNKGGNAVGVSDGETVYEGDVNIIPVSPFEMFPDSLYNEEISDCFSVIHARAVPVREIREKYGVDVAGENVNAFGRYNSVTEATEQGNAYYDRAIVIEKYERPSSEFPCGRLITVAGDKLLYYGELPYKNGKNGERTFPFVKQSCVKNAGCFFGASIVERLIPVQRAFNAVKNRKHEFLNRLSMGIMKVEDGSLDVDDLAAEGLQPGKILVYRQGSSAPEMLGGISMPTDFNEEEAKLLNEFVAISGVSEVSSSMSNANVTSGTALEILVEQDNERLIVPADNIRKCYLEIAKQSLRLYAQFSAGVRAVKVRDAFNNKTKVVYADKSDINTDEVYLENENELLYSHSQKKEMIFKLYNSGLLTDESGRLRPSTKEKVLSLLGYKDLDYQKGISAMQSEKAQNENAIIRKSGLKTEEVDDDEIHADEHTRYILSEYEDLKEDEKARLFAHLKEHKDKISALKRDEAQAENIKM